MKSHRILPLTAAAFLGASYYLGYTPVGLSVIFLLASLAAYYLYAKDKAAAIADDWRVPEKTLHISALFCGWPGALIAQQRLRHKTRKKSFRMLFWFTVLANVAGIAWLHSPQGHQQLREGALRFEQLVVARVPYQAPVATVQFLTGFREGTAVWLR